MQVALRSVFSQRNGYGKDGIGLVREIVRRGHDLRVTPLMVDPPIPKDIALRFTLPMEMRDVTIHHIGPQDAVLKAHNAAVSKRNVLWTMVGWDSLEHSYFRDDFAEMIQHYDDLVVYDEASMKAVSGYFPNENTHMVMGGYEADAWGLPKEPVERPAKYTFGMLGVLGPRKGPMSAIIGYMICKERYGDDFDAQLLLYSNVDVVPPGTTLPEGVHVEVRHWLPSEIQRFYWSIDTLLCPSSAEGKNLPAIEALASGTNVILSDIPAHKAWCDPSLATFVPTVRTEIAIKHEGNMVMPNVMADAMWDAYNNEAKYRERSYRASQRLPAQMDWSKCVERLSLQLGLGL
jgi:glycosyltransferase involved in cell wall biosynthesis